MLRSNDVLVRPATGNITLIGGDAPALPTVVAPMGAVELAVSVVQPAVQAVRRDQAPRPSEGGVADGSVEEIICAYDWPCQEALAVAACESNFDSLAVSADGGNFGWFQINAIHRGRVAGDVSRLLDPHINAAVAYAIWLDYGGHWTAWACRP